MKKKAAATKESFDSLLEWLAADRETAAAKYEKTRRSLINFFYFRGCADPETLADETVNRIMKKIDKLKEEFKGDDSAKYFYGVAYKIYLESRSAQNKRLVQLDYLTGENSEISGRDSNERFINDKRNPDAEEEEERFDCLEECLSKLPQAERGLALRYYGADKGEKNRVRKKLAKENGISFNHLRVKIHRLKNRLAKCVKDCLGEKQGKN